MKIYNAKTGWTIIEESNLGKKIIKEIEQIKLGGIDHGLVQFVNAILNILKKYNLDLYDIADTLSSQYKQTSEEEIRTYLTSDPQRMKQALINHLRDYL